MYDVEQDDFECWFVFYHRIAKGMSNLKKNGQQMSTGEKVGASSMDQSKNQILGQLPTQVTRRNLGPAWKRN